MAFWTCGVDNALDNPSGDGNAKSPRYIDSKARWELGTAIAAAVSSTAVENHGWEFAVHGVCYLFLGFVFARFGFYISTLDRLAKKKYIGISTRIWHSIYNKSCSKNRYHTFEEYDAS